MDSILLLVCATLFAAFAAIAKDAPGTIAGGIAAGAGALEYHGSVLLAAGLRRNRSWLAGSQLLLLGTVLIYCYWRSRHPEIERLRPAITPEAMQALKESGMSADQFLLFVHQLLYAVLAIVTLLYQGGMACYYAFGQKRFAAALSDG